MTKEDFHKIHNYRVSDGNGVACIYCAYHKISDKPIKFTKWPADGNYYPSYNSLCMYMKRPITTGYLCVCDLFEK